MKEKLFVVGDVHGEYDLLEKLLQHWNKEEETLVFLGDLADRGPESKRCFLLVKELVETYQAVCISGNHEVLFLDFLQFPQKKFSHYVMNGGYATLESLFYSGVLEENTPEQLADKIQSDYADLVRFLKALPFYYETDYCLCVHAGVNLDLEDWRETEPSDFVWMREAFFQHEKALEKLIVFGHTPVQYLHKNGFQTHIWYQNHKLNIDGGAAYEGSLHGVVISKNGLEKDYQIFHPNHRWE